MYSMELTRRQHEILAFIRRFMETEGYPPTRADIGRALGFRSPNAAESHLRALARKGAIELQRGTSRGIRLPDMESAAPEAAPPHPGLPEDVAGLLPVVGRVAAGSPLLAEESIEAYRQVDAQLFAPRADYLLRVRGESMRDAGILDGDLLAVHRTSEVRDGQIAVVRLHDEVTVKFLQRADGRLHLHPANPGFSVLEIDPESEPAELEGIGVGVLRDRMPTRAFKGGRA